ncbi:MAG: hypothetical protein FWF59_08280, partial [Turicibacter sp.]|nr:hypothetical protein [Turicibacter sp.]
MEPFQKLKIDIPQDKGVHLRKAGNKGDYFVYKYTEHYFTPKGQRRHRSKMIGKLAESEGEMYPNANYY